MRIKMIVTADERRCGSDENDCTRGASRGGLLCHSYADPPACSPVVTNFISHSIFYACTFMFNAHPSVFLSLLIGSA